VTAAAVEPKAPNRTAAPLDGSVALRIAMNLGPVWWGASWAYMCGVAAAGADGSLRLAGLVAGWLVAVPLLGMAWRPLLGPAPLAGPGSAEPGSDLVAGARARSVGRAAPGLIAILPRRLDGAGRAVAALASDVGTALQRARLAALDVAFGALAALAVAATLGDLVFLAVGAAVCMAVLGRRVSGPSEVGWRRSTLEVGLPAWLGWTAAGGPRDVAAPFAAVHGPGAAAAAWLAANWAVPALAVGFVVLHRAATAVERREDLARRHRELVAGFAVVIAVLAAGGSTLGAASVAVAFALAWPYQAVFRRGRVRWHLEATQPLLMAAMLAAFLGA
jgi:hypothetical protein